MKKSVLVSGMLLFLLVACGGGQSDLASSSDDVVGVWSFTGSGEHFVRFDADGAVAEAPSLDLVTNPPLQPDGEYWFEDNQLNIRTPEDDAICGASEATYEVHLLDTGNLSFVTIDDTCEMRERWFGDSEYARVE